MMIEPGNLIRTNQAYRTLRDHLTDTGTLAIWYPKGLDLKGVLTDSYARAIQGLGIGAKGTAVTGLRMVTRWSATESSVRT